MECLGGEKAFGDTNTHQQYGPEERNAWPPNAHMPFNLAIAVAATIALTYCCNVVLLSVWRALDTGISAKLELPAI